MKLHMRPPSGPGVRRVIHSVIEPGLEPAHPPVGLRLIGGEWYVTDDTSRPPDGYFILDSDGDLAILPGASSGLPLTIDGDGDPSVEVP